MFACATINFYKFIKLSIYFSYVDKKYCTVKRIFRLAKNVVNLNTSK